MKNFDPQTSACRHCRYYIPEGRRGGHCSQLNALVQGSWKACSLAIPVFEPTWKLEKMLVWQGETATALTNQSQAPLPQSSDHQVALDHLPRSEKILEELRV